MTSLQGTQQWPEPGFTFSVDSPYNTTSYNVTWTLRAAYSDPCSLNPQKYCPDFANKGYSVPEDFIQFSYTTTGNQPWSPSTSGTIYAGSVTVQADVKPVNSCSDGVTGTLTFEIWGVNQNSTQLSGAATNAANSVTQTAQGKAWFLSELIGRESGGRQFYSSNGHPVWGGPDGIGLMQVDRTAEIQHPGTNFFTNNNESPYFNFETNLQDGMQILGGKQGTAYRAWDGFVASACKDAGGTPIADSNGLGTESCNINLRTYPQNNAPNLGTVCNPHLTWNTSSPSGNFQDFDWIRLYQGFACGYFLKYQNGAWVWFTSQCVQNGVNFGNYVMDVCAHAPAY